MGRTRSNVAYMDIWQVNKKYETMRIYLRIQCHLLLAHDGGRQAAVSLLADDTGSAPHRWDFSTSIHLHAQSDTHTCKQIDKHTRLPPNDKDQIVYRKPLVIQCWIFLKNPIYSCLFICSYSIMSPAPRGDINTLSSLRIWACENSGTLEEEAMGAG